jgi:FADH2 O2-dependent halogenase
LLPLAKWGSWQKSYPRIACGLKRGFTFFHHTFGKPWTADPERRDQLLVAASPHDGIADTHWYRPDFDHFLVLEAQDLGVEYLDEVKLEATEHSPGALTMRGERKGAALSVRAQFVIDATGPRGFLHRALGLPELPFANLPRTQALYSHFSEVRRWESLGRGACSQETPYPVDAAAMHHVFDGGWIWVLRFNNGLTSAGVAATHELANELRFEEGARSWQRLLQRLPTVQEQFAAAKAEIPFVQSRRLSFRSSIAAGQRWALLPSAAGFVDPLLSTGFPLTLLGIGRLAGVLERDWNSNRLNVSLAGYSQQTFQELETTEELVAALYASMHDFPLFTALSLLYFAAASFTETAKRLGQSDLAGRLFLLSEHPRFGAQARRCVRAVLHGNAAPQELIEEIYSVIEPIDVAGLSDPTRANWHDVRAEDLLKASPKLGVTETEIDDLLLRCGFFEAPTIQPKVSV